MGNIRYWSDLHLGHDNVYKFPSCKYPGQRMRPFGLIRSPLLFLTE